jgi:hypothetical protein
VKKKRSIKVWQGNFGVWYWKCQAEQCRDKEPSLRSGCSMHWEIMQHQADEHAREEHRPPKVLLSHDTPTPPGGNHYDWSETGFHLRITEA